MMPMPNADADAAANYLLEYRYSNKNKKMLAKCRELGVLINGYIEFG
jgi:hypothetical protein